MSTIEVSAGAVEYAAVTITENFGKDISGDAVQMGLGAFDAPPNAWLDATDIGMSASVSSRTVGILIDSGTAPGDYWSWVKIGDDPETVVARGGKVTVK